MEQLRALEKGLQEGYYLTGPKSRPGHSLERISSMLTADMLVGDDEQYAVAMALMARQLGIPARVVMGFYPGEDDSAARGSLAVTGTMAHVWVEVPFDGQGWVSFDPTPDRDRVPADDRPRSRGRSPSRRCCRPPDPPINMLQDSLDKPGNNEDSDRPGENVLLRVLLTLGVAALIASLLAAPFVLIAWLKSRRRERRRHAPEVADRFSGAWAELEDAATDLGTPVSHPGHAGRSPLKRWRRRTRRHRSRRVATAVDAGVFGPGRPTEESAGRGVGSMWTGALAGLHAGLSRWRRLRSFVSLRSFRARRKTAVAVLPSLAKGEAMSVYPYNLTPEGAPTDATGSFPAVAGYTPMTTGRRVAIVLVDGVIGGAVGGLTAFLTLQDTSWGLPVGVGLSVIYGLATLWAVFGRSARLAGLLMKAQYVDVRTGALKGGSLFVKQLLQGRPGRAHPGHPAADPGVRQREGADAAQLLRPGDQADAGRRPYRAASRRPRWRAPRRRRPSPSVAAVQFHPEQAPTAWGGSHGDRPYAFPAVQTITDDGGLITAVPRRIPGRPHRDAPRSRPVRCFPPRRRSRDPRPGFATPPASQQPPPSPPAAPRCRPHPQPPVQNAPRPPARPRGPRSRVRRRSSRARPSRTSWSPTALCWPPSALDGASSPPRRHPRSPLDGDHTLLVGPPLVFGRNPVAPGSHPDAVAHRIDDSLLSKTHLLLGTRRGGGVDDRPELHQRKPGGQGARGDPRAWWSRVAASGYPKAPASTSAVTGSRSDEADDRTPPT
jgi:hypothetical protein